MCSGNASYLQLSQEDYPWNIDAVLPRGSWELFCFLYPGDPQPMTDSDEGTNAFPLAQDATNSATIYLPEIPMGSGQN